MSKAEIWLASFAAVGLCMLDSSAMAQGRGASAANVAVRDRPKPEYAVAGVRVGGFTLFPKLSASLAYEDNVFATATNTVDDMVAEFVPSLELRSNWSTHQLDFSIEAPTRYYSDFTENNTSDASVTMDGRLDVYRDLNFYGGVRYGDLHESLTSSPSALALAAPVAYTRAGGIVGFVKDYNRVRVSGEASYTRFNYDDARLADSTPVDQDDRDHHVTELTGRVDYTMSQMTSIFASVSTNNREYRLDPPSVPVNRDSNGYQGLVGVKFDVTRLMRGEVGVGYLHQSHDATGVGDTSGLAVSSNVQWFPDRLVTVSLGAERRIEDAGAVGASSYIANNASLAVDYEWRRPIILGFRADYSLDDYVGIDREDRRLGAALTADYLMDRGVSFFFEVSHARQTSDGLQFGRKYDANRVLLGVRLAR